jgi:protein-L-isoaspartate O-methyltransferase
LLIATDYAGLVHCFDADTGKRHWYYDCFAAVWSTPLIVDEHVYVTDEDGEMAVFALSPNATKGDSGLPEPLAEMDLGNMVAGSPAFANGTLYVATRTHLFAIQKEKAKERPDGGRTGLSQGPLERTELSPARGGVRTTNSASHLSRVANSAFSPTPPDVVAKMLELARVEEDDVVIDLGSGDGRIVVEAAKQFGCYSIGYELDPTLVRASRQKAREASLKDRVKFHQADLFTADLQRASVVTLYLNPGQNKRLIPQLNRMPHGGRVVAHEFPIPGITPDKVIKFESKDSGESHQLFLFITPLTIQTIEP